MKNEIVRGFCLPFFLKKVDCEEIMASLNSEITKSLCNIDKTKVDLKMFNTHVSRFPVGFEKGRYLAVDFLGDEHRLALVTFSPKNHCPQVDNVSFRLPAFYHNNSFSEILEYIAGTISEFLANRGADSRLIYACLSIPFPLYNTNVGTAEVVQVTKGFVIRHYHGVEICSLFQRHLDSKGAKVKCVAVVNDSTSIFGASAVDEVDCAASFVLNAGVNMAYVEKVSNIRREETFEEDAKAVIINTELAGFGDGGALKRFMTEFDKRLDRISESPGSLTFERFVGGAYLGELVRQILKLLTERGQIFSGVWPTSLREFRSFQVSYLCEIDRDPPHLFYSTEFVLREDLKITNLTPEDVHIVRYVCQAVVYRAACLTAAAAVTILKRLNRLRVTMGVDGYMFRQHPTFYKQMLTIMAELMPKHMTFRLKLANEGYSIGTAVIAALYKDNDK